MINTGLRDRVVLITGVNNPCGIGAAAAKAFAADGARIFGTYLPLPPRHAATDTCGLEHYEELVSRPPDEVVDWIRDRGGTIEVVPADLVHEAVIPELFNKAEKAFGPVEVLVNNAAYDTPDTFVPQSAAGKRGRRTGWNASIATITAESHDRHFAVNSRAVALMMAEFARRAVERKGNSGRIINVSSDGASGFGTEVSYGASKYALESYSRAAAKELGKFGITVNVVSLGPIQTGWIAIDLELQIAARTPLGRVGRPEDVADVILFLASEQARWLTGQVLYVGGGYRMSL